MYHIMKETIFAEPGLGGSRIRIDDFSRTPFKGGREDKNLLEGTIGSHRVSLIERDYNPHYVTNWHAFREVGLPVVPTLRTSSWGTLLLTDMKADGSEFYGKNLSRLLCRPRKDRFRERPEIDKLFLELADSDEYEEVIERTHTY